MSNVKYHVANIKNKYTISAIKMRVPSLQVPALSANRLKIPPQELVLNLALGDFAPQA